MRKSTAQSIIMLATSDPETDAVQLEALKSVCAGKFRPSRTPALLNTNDALDLLGRGVRRASLPLLYRLERDGKVHRAPRTGRRVYYYRDELERLVYGDSASYPAP